MPGQVQFVDPRRIRAMVRHYPAPARPCRARQWTAFRDAEGRTLSLERSASSWPGCAALRPETAFHRRRPTLPSTRVHDQVAFSKTTLQFTEGSGLLRTT